MDHALRLSAEPTNGAAPEKQNPADITVNGTVYIRQWCPEEDSNLHTLRHTDLNRARLPIPPPGHDVRHNET